MMTKNLWPLLLLVAVECYGQANGDSPGMADRFNSAFEKAAKKAGAVKTTVPSEKSRRARNPGAVASAYLVYPALEKAHK